MSAPPRLVTLSTQNQFSFVCPIFNAETKMAACMVLREAVWMGKRVDKRKGCQACMKGSKCPAAAIVMTMARSASSSSQPIVDAYGSLTPMVGKLGADVLEPLLNRVVGDRLMDQVGVPLNERLLIASADERIAKQLQRAPREAKGKTVRPAASTPRTPNWVKSSKPKPEPAAPVVPDAIAEAARTGDMSAAINQGTQN